MITPKGITFDIRYEVRLQQPIFALGTGGVPSILKAVYEGISPRYYIASSGLRGHTASTFADLVAEITLFNGIGTLSIFGDRYTFSVSNLGSDADIDTFVDCVNLGEKALSGIVDFPQTVGSSIAVEGKVELDDASPPGMNFANEIVTWTKQPEFQDLGNPRLNRILQTELISDEQGWTCLLRVGTAEQFPKELLISLFFVYSEATTLKSIDQKREHVGLLFERVARFVGIGALP